MTDMIDRRTFIALTAAAGAAAAAGPVAAQEAVVVEMLNAHPDNPRQTMVFHPRLVVVEPGTTVRFVPTDRSHNTETLDGMVPEGAEGWAGRTNEEVEVTLDQPGVYGYICKPHYAMGMVGAVVVRGDGALDNLDAAKEVRQRGRARDAFAEIFEEIEALDL